MCDRYERTRSWFQVVPLAGDTTLLRFGSAVAAAPESAVADRAAPRREARVLANDGAVFQLLLKFHILYSQLLLSAAGSGVMKAARRMDVGER